MKSHNLEFQLTIGLLACMSYHPTTKIKFHGSRVEVVEVLRGRGLEMVTIHARRDDRNTIGVDLKSKGKNTYYLCFCEYFWKRQRAEVLHKTITFVEEFVVM